MSVSGGSFFFEPFCKRKSCWWILIDVSVVARKLCERLKEEILHGKEEIKPWMSYDVRNSLIKLSWQDDDAYPTSSVGSHSGLALLVVDVDASVTSVELY